jgi:ABC-2 type transport system permease protein
MSDRYRWSEPGSLLWLLRHDLRLSRRRFADMFARMTPKTRVAVIGGAGLVLHALATPLAFWLVALSRAPDQAAMLTAVIAAGVLFVLPWMFAQSITSATRTLFARGDLDLLLASPVPSRFVLTSRAVSIALESLGSVAILLVPIANMCALLGGAHWLAMLPTLGASAMLAAAGGLAAAMGLLRLVGPRRARLVSQIVATFIGAGFVLALQGLAIVSDSSRLAVVAALAAAPEGSLLHRASALWLPVRSAMGEPSALLAWCALSVAALGLVIAALGPRFSRLLLTTVGTPQTVSRRRMRAPIRFADTLGQTLRRKEWRLLSRDPFLGSQLLLQIIYTLPVSIVLWRSQGPEGSVALAVAPSLVVITAQIAASLSWLAISGEDAPEFLRTAPVTRRMLDLHKLAAVALPVALLMALPLGGLLVLSIRDGLLTAAFCAMAGTSTSLINLWHPMPGTRRNMMHRHQQSKLVGLLEHTMSLLWAMAAVMAMFQTWWVVLPVLLAVALLGGIHRWHGVGGRRTHGAARRSLRAGAVAVLALLRRRTASTAVR